MVDYYAILLRAVQAAKATDEASRRAVYERARHILSSQLRLRRMPVTPEEYSAHHSSLEAAVERLEREIEHAGGRVLAVADVSDVPARPYDADAEPAIEPPDDDDDETTSEPQPVGQSRWSRPAVWITAAAVGAVAVVGVAGYVTWTVLERGAPSVSASASSAQPPTRRRVAAADPVVDLAPGVDGGSGDTDLPFIYKRQRVFYRTPLPAGTIVVDKLQRFLYLVLPDSSAVRYGIGVGESCAELVGLKRVALMEEWPEWRPPSRFSSTLPGGPGNPMGARRLDLDDGSSSIHGTNAPKTIGSDVTRGCVRLVNDDVVDLYGRVGVGTRVVMR